MELTLSFKRGFGEFEYPSVLWIPRSAWNMRIQVTRALSFFLSESHM